MGHINGYGMARAFPYLREHVDYQVVDSNDGKGPQIVWLGDCERPDDLAAAIAATTAWQAEQEALAYRHQRTAEYPPISEFIDAQVKKASADPAVRAAGEAQEAEYIAACQAVKEKFPKP